MDWMGGGEMGWRWLGLSLHETGNGVEGGIMC